VSEEVPKPAGVVRLDKLFAAAKSLVGARTKASNFLFSSLLL